MTLQLMQIVLCGGSVVQMEVRAYIVVEFKM
jgi:hypothetical protein